MHPSSSILHILQHVESYVATNLSSSYLEAARIIEEKFLKLLGFLSMKLATMSRCVAQFITHSFWRLVFQSNPFVVQLIYFMAISFAGFLALKSLNPHGKPVPRDFDLMFTSVSTATVSSMSTIQMEDLSDQQLWILILLMLLGGEVFTSMLGLHLNNAKANREELSQRSLSSIRREIEASISANNVDQIDMESGQSEAVISHNQVQQTKSTRHSSRTILAHIVTGYFLASVVCSSVVIIIYFWLNSDARQVLQSKEIKICTFAIFTAMSSFANCGFTPLNSNMQAFTKNSDLLLLVIPQILAGNTLFSPLLRLSVWALGKVSGKQEYTHILQHPEETGYKHLPTQRNSVYIFLTVTGLILLQVICLFSFERGSKAFGRMNWFQKLVGSLFQSANTRQAGEAVVDISTFSSPTLLLFAIVIAFGNVGYSLGYSCEKLMKPDAACKAASYGFVGWWTDEGKLIIILVMFIGRLKKFIIKEEKD